MGLNMAQCLKSRKVNFSHPETNLKGENPPESKESNLKSLSPLRYESMYILYLQESMTTC